MDDADHGPVRQQLLGAHLVLTLCNPPVNALGHATRAGIAAGLDRALADPAIDGIILTGDGRGFSAGADIREFGQPARNPLLPELCRRIEDFPKPIVVAMHGVALGGGLELALAARARIGMAGLRVGLPEVNLGIVPGAGGTQRLPRLIGAKAALRIILGGQPISAKDAFALGLLDHVAQTAEELIAAARAAAQAGQTSRAPGPGNPADFETAVAAARRDAVKSGIAAHIRAVDCVEAALLLPRDQGFAFERAAFDDLRASPEAAALRHVFLAERRADHLPAGLEATDFVAVSHLGVWGAGGAAADLAGSALRAGLKVTLCDPSRDALVSTLEAVGLAQEAEVAKGDLAPEARDADWARLFPATDPMALSGVQVVILTDADRPLAVDFARGLSPLVTVLVAGGVPPGAVADVMGIRFAPQRVVEVAQAAGMLPGTVATGLSVLRKLRWRPVMTGLQGRTPGIGARVTAAGKRAAQVLINGGVPLAQVVRATAPFLRLPGGWEDRPGALLAIQDATIADRVLAAMANEGARLLSEGVALRASDIDVILIGGYGFARNLGGPMHQADLRGLMVLRRNLRIWAIEDAIWAPDPLFDVLIAEGQTFASLDQL